MISLTSPHKTPYHRLPAGAKLAVLCGVTILLYQIGQPLLHLGAVLAVGLLYLLPGRRFFVAGLRLLYPLWPFLAVIAIWHGVSGTPVAGLVVAARLLAAIGLANLVTMTTRLDDLIGVLRWVLTPLRHLGLKTQKLELSIALVVRFTPVLAQKGSLLIDAWRSRSARRAGWRILLPFSLLALDDAEHVAEALRARGGVK